MKKAILSIFFFALFFVLVDFFGIYKVFGYDGIIYAITKLSAYPVMDMFIGFLYGGFIFSALCTRILTPREHSEFENTNKYFNRFFGKFLLANLILLTLFMVLVFGIFRHLHFIGSAVASLIHWSGIYGVIGILIFLPILSYSMAHIFYIAWLKARDTDKPWWNVPLKVLKVVSIIILIVLAYNFARNRLYAASLPYRNGEIVTITASVGCGKRKPERPGWISEMLSPCQRDYLTLIDPDEPERSPRFMLTYRGQHWTSIEDWNGITVTGIFKSRPDYNNHIGGKIELTSVESSAGIDLLAISELEKASSFSVNNNQPVWNPTLNDFVIPTSGPKHGKDYDFRKYYIARYEPEPRIDNWQGSENYQPVPETQDMGSSVSGYMSKTKDFEPTITVVPRVDGGIEIIIFDPSEKLTPVQEEQMRREAIVDFYNGKTPSIPNTLANAYSGSGTASTVPTTQEIMQIFIDNPDFTFSPEEQRKRSAYTLANPFSSSFGYFSPQKTVPDPNVKKIMYWPGKLNQHWDIATQKWISDPDGVSGADIRESIYCTKWYGTGSGVAGHANETISTWREAGKTEMFTATRVSMQCL